LIASDCLDVKKFIKGTCFICNKECENNAYLHNSCAIAYEDEKNRRYKEALNDQKIK
jgi:hypothetical protein